MFIIDKTSNEAVGVQRATFAGLGFSERKHLQEWIAKNPAMLGEELLIIQKEFAGFGDTNERLDLLALDKNGDLVIIENKLDDSGKDVTWQTLKYVSYCAGLTKSEIVQIYQKYLADKNAEEEICSFLEQEDFAEINLNQGDQRIIIVAANFRKEVTSTVMWLIDHKIKIKCIKDTPFLHGENIFIDTEQIIPIKDAEEYQIKLAGKKQQELIATETNQSRYNARVKYWDKFLQKINEKSSLYGNVIPSKEYWQSVKSGYKGISYSCVVTRLHARIELYIDTGSQEHNKQIFDNLYKRKEDIEAKFGDKLEWERLEKYRTSKIVYYLPNVSIFNEDDWDKMIGFQTDNMIKFEAALRDELKPAISENM